MPKKYFHRPFSRLRGKLTLTYTVTTTMTLILMLLVGVGIALLISSWNINFFALNLIKQEAPQAAPYFIHGSPDRNALASWLQFANNPDAPNKQGPFSFSNPTFITVVDKEGRTITSVGSHPVPDSTLVQTQLSPQSRVNLTIVLHDVRGETSKIVSESDGTLLGITPIVGSEGKVEGALVMKIAPPSNLQLIVEFLQFLVVALVIITFLAIIVGTISGYITARGITRRLKGLTVAADHWSHGDFSVQARDSSEDELGQTTRQLNSMAEQLQNLLQARQKLATLEERNRLARDLHDSVKQQVFSVALQIGATRLLLRRDVDAAEVRLAEAQKLIKQAQQELTSLIRELRPVALEDKGLPVALRELVTQWAKQTDIVANLLVEGPQQTLPLTVEEALYRVAQEALANVARHSKATLVQMSLEQDDNNVVLSIVDNGQGFDVIRHGHMGVGLLSMQERMKALGGDVHIESNPGKGARIIAQCLRLGIVRSPGAGQTQGVVHLT